MFPIGAHGDLIKTAVSIRDQTLDIKYSDLRRCEGVILVVGLPR